MNSHQDTGMNPGAGLQEPGQHTTSGGTAHNIAQRSREAGASVKEKARETRERIVNKGSERVRQAKDQTRVFADERKNQLGERIHHYSSAVRRAADKLRDEEDPNIAHYADMVAERIDQAADYVQSRDAESMFRDVENAARRRPEIFFGGMFFAGLMLSRFLKASSRRDYQMDESEDYWVENSQTEPAEMESGFAGSNDGSFSMSSTAESDWQGKPSGDTNPQGNI